MTTCLVGVMSSEPNTSGPATFFSTRCPFSSATRATSVPKILRRSVSQFQANPPSQMPGCSIT